jgi:putative phosphoribosyl transferase
LRREVDEVRAVITPGDFSSVGEWYADFTQTTDEEVRSRLQAALAREAPLGSGPG